MKSGGEKAKVYLSIANTYLNTNPDSTIFYAKKALSLATKANDLTETARSYAIIADGFQKKNQLQSSIEYYLKTIQFSEKHHLESVLGSAYNGLGVNYYYLDDMSKAETYIKKGAAAKLKAKDYTYYTIILTNLASLYFYQERYHDAIDILLSAEKELIKEGEEYYLASLYNSIGASYQLISPELDSAEIYYQKSIDYATKFKIQDNLITGYHNLGELHFKRKNYSQAIQFLKKAELESEKFAIEKYKLSVYATLSEVYETMGDFSNALYYKKLEYELNKSVFTTEKQKTIEELEIKYETAKKEQEIQAQKEEIQQTKLSAEKAKNRFYLILFSGLIVFILAGFSVVFILQRKKSARLLEQEKLKIFENIVHDIRTPVTLIKGPLQLLKKDLSTHQRHATNFELIERNSEKLLHLVNELLDASKLDRGKYQVVFQTGNIDVFVQSILHSFSSESKDKNIDIEYISSKSELTHSYCANALEKILFNLVSNALKYCASGSKVTVQTRIEGNTIQLVVADNGPGIPQKEQSKIFDRFYRRQQDKATTGTGIGLSLVKDLVEVVQGSIELKSEYGKGTTFLISIPVETIDQSTSNSEIDASKFQLLLCEDDPDIVTFVCGFLEDEFNITVASNGQEGLTKFTEVLPDIVLSDVMMPIMDGIELLHAIKSDEMTNHTPVVLFSAKSSLESRLKGLSFGADAYIAKPFNPDELRLVLQNLINTIQRNQQTFQSNIQSEKTFEERVKSTNEYLNKAIAFVVNNIDSYEYSVNELAEDLCISRSQLHRKLTTYSGFSAANFIKMIRLEKAKDLLKTHQGNVTEIAYACGFNSQSYFSTAFTEYVGESPTKFMSKSQ